MNRIGVNARVLSKPNMTGVGRYTLQLVNSLSRLDSEFKFLLFGVEEMPKKLKNRRNVVNVEEPALSHSGIQAQIWEQFLLPRIVSNYDIRLLHTPAGNPPITSNVPLVTTIHDISPIVHPEWFSRTYTALYRTLVPLAIRSSDRILTVSEFSRREISRKYPRSEGRIHVTPLGVTEGPDVSTDDAVDGLSEDEYFLFVGAMNPRKNIERLVKGYHWYRERTEDPIPLVLAGPPRDLFSSFDIAPVDGLRQLGYVSDRTLQWLYRNALAFVFPSLYEGFGMPILEAMTVGTPVITSDKGPMAEIAGDAGRLVNPYEASAIGKAMVELAIDEDIQSSLTSAGRLRADSFTWERTAERTRDMYLKVLENR